MGGIFGGGRRVTPPTVQRVSPPPTVSQESSDWAMRRAQSTSGFQQTILTGDLRPRSTGRRTVLG